MQYSAPWPAASVWVSMTPTWGDPESMGRELSPVMTPVRHDVMDLPIDTKAPDTPGQYWILVVVNAEPSGGFSLSGTNWSLDTPIWNDGNDVATLPDSIIRQANARGWIESWLALPALWNTNGGRVCRAPTRAALRGKVKYCATQLALFGIGVTVR